MPTTHALIDGPLVRVRQRDGRQEEQHQSRADHGPDARVVGWDHLVEEIQQTRKPFAVVTALHHRLEVPGTLDAGQEPVEAAAGRVLDVAHAEEAFQVEVVVDLVEVEDIERPAFLIFGRVDDVPTGQLHAAMDPLVRLMSRLQEDRVCLASASRLTESAHPIQTTLRTIRHRTSPFLPSGFSLADA